MKDSTVKKLFLDGDQTPCAKYMASGPVYVLWPALAVVLWLFPWEWLYQVEGYHAFIEFMAGFTRSIRDLPQSKSQFIEYAQAYIAAVNFIGMFYLILAVRCGWKHARSEAVIERNRDVSNRQFVRVIFIGFVGLVMSALAVWVFYGEMPETVMPDYFLRYKLAFVFVHLSMWWALSLCVLGLVATIRLFFIKLHLNKEGR